MSQPVALKRLVIMTTSLNNPRGPWLLRTSPVIFDVVRRRTEEQLVHVQVSAANFGVKARPAHIDDPETRHTYSLCTITTKIIMIQYVVICRNDDGVRGD
jgi:hypothetical protein